MSKIRIIVSHIKDGCMNYEKSQFKSCKKDLEGILLSMIKGGCRPVVGDHLVSDSHYYICSVALWKGVILFSVNEEFLNKEQIDRLGH